MPAGGIEPLRSRRTTFSQVAAPSPTLVTSSVSSVRPAVFSFWLWQVTQYLSNTARAGTSCAATAAGAVGAGCWRGATPCAEPDTVIATQPAISGNNRFILPPTSIWTISSSTS